tara:strand:+ start:145 stop:1425 length:1281 start_codon:yes stop_codon:yes gene_type:complete
MGDINFNNFIIIVFLAELLSIIIIFGLDDALIRFYRDKVPHQIVLSNISFFCIISSFIVTVIWVFIDLNKTQLFTINVNENLKYLILLYSIIYAFFKLISVHYISAFKVSSYRNINILRSFFIISSTLLFLNSDSDLNEVLIILVISNLLLFLFFWDFFKIKISSVDFKRILEYLKFSSPLIIYGIFSLTSDYSSRIILQYINFDPVQLSAFNFYIQIVLLFQGLNRIFNKFWNPYSQKLLSEKKDIIKISESLAIIFTIVFWIAPIVLCIVDDTFIVELLVKKSFSNNFHFLILLIPAIVYNFIYMIYVSRYYYLKRTVEITFLNLITNVFSIIITTFLSYNYGSLGAIIGFNISCVISVLFLSIIFYKDRIFNKIYKVFSFNLILLILNFYIITSFNSIYVLSLGFIIFAFAFSNINKIKISFK